MATIRVVFENGEVWAARILLWHVFECDGLSIVAELLLQQTMQRVLDMRDCSFQANLDVLRWDDTIRWSELRGGRSACLG
jgi:hypothetical protein